MEQAVAVEDVVLETQAHMRAHDDHERDETETDAYMRISAMRYRALRTHEWSDEVLEELRRREERRKHRRRPPPAQQRRRLR